MNATENKKELQRSTRLKIKAKYNERAYERANKR